MAELLGLAVGTKNDGRENYGRGRRAQRSRGAAYNKAVSICRVASGMPSAPVPRAAHEAIEVRILRFPAQFALDFFRTGPKYRRVAGAARRFWPGNRMAGHFANRVDHFAHAEALPISQVVDELGFFLQRF